MFYCELCNKNLDFVLLDGYNVGDRLLEGVLFKIFQKKDGSYKVELYNKDDQAYCKNLNMRKWLKEIKEFASETDIATCPNCGWDIIINDPNNEFPFDLKSKKELLGILKSKDFLFSTAKELKIVPQRIISLEKEIEEEEKLRND